MKVRMKTQILGTRNGVAWPAVGETVELLDDEGARMCQRGFAEPVAEAPQLAKATARKAEKRG